MSDKTCPKTINECHARSLFPDCAPFGCEHNPMPKKFCHCGDEIRPGGGTVNGKELCPVCYEDEVKKLEAENKQLKEALEIAYKSCASSTNCASCCQIYDIKNSWKHEF